MAATTDNDTAHQSACAAGEGYDLVGEVMAKDQAALRIYERLGWRQIGTARHDTGHGTEVPALLFVHQAPQT